MSYPGLLHETCQKLLKVTWKQQSKKNITRILWGKIKFPLNLYEMQIQENKKCLCKIYHSKVLQFPLKSRG